MRLAMLPDSGERDGMHLPRAQLPPHEHRCTRVTRDPERSLLDTALAHLPCGLGVLARVHSHLPRVEGERRLRVRNDGARDAHVDAKGAGMHADNDVRCRRLRRAAGRGDYVYGKGLWRRRWRLGTVAMPTSEQAGACARVLNREAAVRPRGREEAPDTRLEARAVTELR